MWAFPVFGSAALALLTERLFGYPKWIEDRIGHPVVWIGAWIAWLDRRLNHAGAAPADARLRGILALAAILAAAFVPAWMISRLLQSLPLGWVIEAMLATALLAQKSLRDHVVAVYRGLSTSLADGREAVSHIVGRDPARLDEAGVSRAALESLAENTSDGIVAPVFWYALLGLPGIAVYKAVNTADSMIGHKTDRHLHFGWASARFDDLINLPCSRITGLLFAATQGRRFWPVVEVMRRDAPRHQSPNAGWPEAALAAALEIRLGGPRHYDGEVVDLPWMGEGRSDLNRTDIRRGLKVYARAMTLLFILLAVLVLVT
jgi:adenosylcobinamide-phosphate synthase